MKKEMKGIWQVVFAQFLIGFIYVLVKLGDSFGIYNLAFFRILLAAIFLGTFFMFSRKYKLSKIKKEKSKLLVFGVLHGLITLASFISIKYLSIAMAVFLSSTISVWMVVFSYLMLKEKITKLTIAALLISLAGLVILVNPADLFVRTTLIGILTGLFVGIGGGFIYTLSKTFKTYDKVSLTFWQNLIATPFLLPLLFIKTPNFDLINTVVVVSMGLIGVFSFILLYLGFGLIKGQKGAILSLLNVVFTLILGFLFFTQVPSLRELIGGILIVIGSYLATK